MATTRLKLITIDAFGTIFNFKEPPFKIYCQIARAYGLVCNEDNVAKNFKLSYKQQHAKWPYYGATSGITAKLWWTTLVHSTFKGALGSQYQFEKVSLIGEELYSMYCSPDMYSIYSDFEPFIELWKGREDVKFAVLSNSDVRLRTLLEKMNLLGHFDCITISEEVKSRKPEKEIFLHTLRHFSPQILPQSVLHVGDDAELDYKAATSLGWKSLLIDRKAVETGSTSVIDQGHVCKSFEEASNCIEAIFKYT